MHFHALLLVHKSWRLFRNIWFFLLEVGGALFGGVRGDDDGTFCGGRVVFLLEVGGRGLMGLFLVMWRGNGAGKLMFCFFFFPLYSSVFSIYIFLSNFSTIFE